MLREMPAALLMEWRAYWSLEPFGSRFDDARTASLRSTLWNIHRDQKRHPQPFEMKRFSLMESDDVRPAKQTWQEQKAILKMIALAFAERPKEQ